MSQETYEQMRDRCIEILKNYFKTVTCPPEAPGKQDYGDVDLVVCDPKADAGANLEALKIPLGAERAISQNVTGQIHGHVISFAIPHAILGSANGPDEPVSFAQIDLTVVDADQLDWYLWQHSYGDLTNIIGKFIRGCGLKANNTGLFVRVKEFEDDPTMSEKDALFFLSQDADSVCEFLGLDRAEWHRGFKTLNELFSWCCQGRFFSCSAFRDCDYSQNDKTRLKKRPAFQEFAEVWLPSHASYCFPPTRPQHNRNEVRNTTLKFFSRQDEFDNVMTTFKQRREEEMTEEALWDTFDPLIPRQPKRIRYIKRALRRWTEFVDGRPRVRDQPEDDARFHPKWTQASTVDVKELQDFVVEHWDDLKEKEKARDEEKRARKTN